MAEQSDHLAFRTAESNPRDKDVMIRLTMNMLTGGAVNMPTAGERQIEMDGETGKLDRVAQSAIEEHKAGETKRF